MRTIYLKKVGSTNDYAKKIKDQDEDVAVIAKRQTGGRGTKGRSFISDEGGIFLSLLKFYPCKAQESFTIMTGAALSVVKTLHAFGINAKIKWPNDIFVNGKKICGILIENVFEGEYVKRSVIGIGLNVNNEISDEIKDIAISMKEVTGKEQNLESVLATLCFNLYQIADLNEYRKHLLYIGEEVTVITQTSVYKAIIDGIDEKGNLKLAGGEILSAAEVSIR